MRRLLPVLAILLLLAAMILLVSCGPEPEPPERKHIIILSNHTEKTVYYKMTRNGVPESDDFMSLDKGYEYYYPEQGDDYSFTFYVIRAEVVFLEADSFVKKEIPYGVIDENVEISRWVTELELKMEGDTAVCILTERD